MDLANTTVLITGATGGIGATFARALSKQGAHLLVSGRNLERLQQLADKLPNCHCCQADLLNGKQRRALVNKATELQVDILINAAGVNQLAFLEDHSDRDIVNAVTTNLTLPMVITRDCLGLLGSRPEAVIVNVGSILGSIGHAGMTAYCASKFGLRGFSESLRRELADTRIKVVYFAPRATATTMNADQAVAMNTELGVKIDSPQWVAEQLVKTLQKNKAFAYLGWPEKLFVRINSLLPKLVDKFMLKQLPTIRKYCK